MRKIFTGFLVIAMLLMSVLAVSGCGVKSDLARPDSSFPRDYPVY